MPIHANRFCIVIDNAALFGKHIKRRIIQKQNANIFENAHAGIVNRGNTVSINWLDWWIAIGRRCPIKLVGKKRPFGRLCCIALAFGLAFYRRGL